MSGSVNLIIELHDSITGDLITNLPAAVPPQLDHFIELDGACARDAQQEPGRTLFRVDRIVHTLGGVHRMRVYASTLVMTGMYSS